MTFKENSSGPGRDKPAPRHRPTRSSNQTKYDKGGAMSTSKTQFILFLTTARVSGRDARGYPFQRVTAAVYTAERK
jgi:hypothetical protein